MMRKISKIIALILAIAMVLCPVLTAAAETEAVVYSTADLDLLRDENGAIVVDGNGKSTAIVTVTTLEAVNAIDFQINFAKGVTFDINTDTVAVICGSGSDAWSVQKGYKDGVLTVAAYDNSENFDQAQTEVVFNITVTIAELGEHEFYLSKIFAVGEGEANAEYVASFKYADEAQSGVIDVVTAKTDAEVDYFETTSCLHPNTTTATKGATCTEAGSIVETCDDCGKVISSETTGPLGHTYNNIDEACYLEVAYDGALYAVCDAQCAVCGTPNEKYYDAEGNLTADLAELAETDPENVYFIEDIAPEHDIAADWSYNETGHWKECSCGEQHEYADHTWDEGTVTTAAQPGVAGVMTYACTAACGATKTEEIPALPEIDDGSSFINEVVLSYTSAKQSVSGKVSYTKAQTKALANHIKGLGGQITKMGIKMTKDGSDPTTSATAFYQATTLTTSNWNTLVSSGLSFSASAAYSGMNFKQIAQTNLAFAACAEYTLNGETVTIYGNVNTGNLLDYLQTQTDEVSVALLKAYNLSQTASTATTEATVSLDPNYGPTYTGSYDLKNVKATGKIAYTKAQTKALANYIKGLGGQITKMGIKMTKDGSDPTTSATAFYQATTLTTANWNTLVSSGLSFSASAAYSGMNVKQFATTLKFVACYEYKDANGDTHIAYIGEVQSITFIDAIADDDSETAVAYKELYNLING